MVVTKAVIFFAVVFAIFCQLHARRKLPSYIKTCERYDPEVNACILKNGAEAIQGFINGDRKLGVPNLKPFQIDEIIFKPGGNFQMRLTEIKILGLDKLEFVNSDFQPDNKIFSLKLTANSIDLEANYETTGRILIVPIEGSGPCQMGLLDTVFNYTMHYDLVKKDGEEYMSLTDSSLIYDTRRAVYNFTGLFHNNKRLSDDTNKFLNDNHQELAKEFKPAVAKIINEIIQNLLNKVIGTAPYDEIFPLSKKS